MRGAPLSAMSGAFSGGIIPADAGSTVMMMATRRKTRDHPRGCGEHKPILTITDLIQGSSPRMRGALVNEVFRSWPKGIIPADAGSTCWTRAVRHKDKDHPRGCGEHVHRECAGDKARGSSPRMRGARGYGSCLPGRVRIIPADAGSTPGSYNSMPYPGDHPRGCGEHPLYAPAR